jgi:hypothetical protein
MTTVLRVDGSGAGSIEHSMVFTNAGLAQLRQLLAFSGGRAQNFDPLSEQQARDLAAVIGQGVTYVSSTPVKTPSGQGREATYAFTDVNQLKISTTPPAPAGVAIKTPGLTTEGAMVTFALTREANGNAVLHIHVPDPNWLSTIGSANASGQLAMLKPMLAGATLELAVEPSGTLVRTSSPYVDGPRVTLLAVDLDEVLKDETLLPRLAAATTEEEIAAIAKAAAGLKITFDRDISVEFTPGR